MNKNRIEAFSDGVIAIIITIMVLAFKTPHDPTLETYLQDWPVFASYALSFLFVGLYWASHHNLFHHAKKVDNKTLWINMAGLFWLSLTPYATAAMGENNFKPITVTIYALLMALCVTSYLLLVNALCRLHGRDSEFARSFKGGPKSYLTLGLNLLAAVISAVGFPKSAFLLLFLKSLAWLFPNHDFESRRLPKH